MRRTLLSIIALFVAAIMLAACSPGNKDDGDDEVQTEDSVQKPKKEPSAAEKEEIEKSFDFLSIYAKDIYGIELNHKDDIITFKDKSLVIGMADVAANFDENISSVSAGGYMLRCNEKGRFIFAPDSEGLDKGVRYFAKNCMNENGFSDTEIMKVESGYRIKKLTVGGNDISLYSIKIPENTDGDIDYASIELQKYIAQACGISLEISAAASSEYVIEIQKDSSSDSDLKSEGFLITTTDKKITIEGGYKRGCTYGVFEFLERYIGWRFLRTDMYYLYEAEHIDIPAGINDLQKPGFEYRSPHNGMYSSLFYPTYRDLYAKLKNNGEYLPDGLGSDMLKACHGLRNFGYKDEVICFSDKDFIEKTRKDVKEYIQKQIDEGLVIGVDFHGVDVSKTDTFENCNCKNCRVIIKQYGYSLAAPMIEFTNIIARDVKEIDPRLYVTTLAYAGLNKPPVGMKTEDNVIVSYCFYIPDNQHHISGDNGPKNCKNKVFAKEYIEWTKIAPQVDVWYYPNEWMYDIAAAPNVLNVYYDMKFLADNNCRGVFALASDGTLGNGFEDLASYMTSRCLWNPHMSYDEFTEQCREWMYIMFGDGYETVWDYYLSYEEAVHVNNELCWSNMREAPQNRTDADYVKEHYDEWWDMYIKARSLCSTAKQQENIEKCFIHMNILGIAFTHTSRYLNGSEAERAVIAERYKHLHEVILKYDRRTTYASDLINKKWPSELDLELNPLMVNGIPKHDYNNTWTEDFLKG